MVLRPTLLLVPSLAAKVEWPRRLASTGRAVAGLLPFRLRELAEAVAEPVLLGSGARAWNGGLLAHLAERHLNESPALPLDAALPRGTVARALARTLGEMRSVRLPPRAIDALAARTDTAAEDAARLRALAHLYRRFEEDMQEFLDPVRIYEEAAARVGDVAWLRGCDGLLVEPLEARGVKRVFLEALGRVVPLRLLERGESSAGDGPGVAFDATVFAPLEPKPRPKGLARLAGSLFGEPIPAPEVSDASVEFVTASSEAAEVRAITRRLLRAAAAGVPFEEMGVLLPRADVYAPLFADLFDRLEIPYRLHPSLPLRFGRAARSLLLLFRCRALGRAAVMEFLTFTPPTNGADRAGQWDLVSREAGIVSGRERFRHGLERYASEQRRDAAGFTDDARRQRYEARAGDALRLRDTVESLADTLAELSGEASWAVWSERLLAVLDRWIGEAPDRDAVRDVLLDLGGLSFASAVARWGEVERVIEARFEWERVPLGPTTRGSIHVGVLDALVGVPFRFVAIPGLVEGGYPGVVRPDPFLLDAEREALGRTASAAPAAHGQLGLFDEGAASASSGRRALDPLPTSRDRLADARRAFLGAVRQAHEILVLSYPRADPQTGRERLPSLFFAAAASARAGKPLSSAELMALVVEDDVDSLGLGDTVDVSERDRVRMRRGDADVAAAIGTSCPHFHRSRHAAKRRWSRELTIYDGLVDPLPPDLALRLDPATASAPISASRLATYARCGFQYMLQYVLRLEPTDEPEERLALSPLEKGDLFHRVAEKFLRGLREDGLLPVKNDPPTRQRLLELADAELSRLAAESPPRFTALWDRECQAFRGLMLSWLSREADPRFNTTPMHFEVGFGPGVGRAPDEPHLADPITIDLKDGRTLRVSGKIDRIDRAQDGTLVLRDYKTGRAPKDDNRVFKGGSQLQIPFYVLAAAQLFPGQTVSRAFLDYVNGGRDVALDLKAVRSEAFPALLRRLVEVIGSGVFVQEPSSCTFCDFKMVCGPQPHLELRRLYKSADPRVNRVLSLREVR